MRKQLSVSLASLLLLALLNSSSNSGMAAPATKAASGKTSGAKAAEGKPQSKPAETKAQPKAEEKSDTNSAAAEKPASSAKQKLHRADFTVSGASCVACLRRIAKTVRDQKGVLKADISIFKPYWAIVIYDAEQTNMDKLFETVKEEKIKFNEMEDKPIATMPMIIIPKGVGSSAASSNAATTDSGSSAAH